MVVVDTVLKKGFVWLFACLLVCVWLYIFIVHDYLKFGGLVLVLVIWFLGDRRLSECSVGLSDRFGALVAYVFAWVIRDKRACDVLRKVIYGEIPDELDGRIRRKKR